MTAAPDSMAPLGPVRSLVSPASGRSGEPCLVVASDSVVYMSWFEAAGKGHALRVARLLHDRWMEPVTVAVGDSFFVNWADFPALAVLGNGRLAVAWPWKHGGGTYAYDVRVAFSADDGRTWSPPTVPHRDDTATEHGFVSMVPDGDGVRLVWLDGRNFAEPAGGDSAGDAAHASGEHGPGGEMTLRTARIGRDGSIRDEAEIDGRVCDCCQTAAAAVPGGLVVAYRDRSEAEIRDISVARLERGRWTTPATVGSDNWKIAGCPVNGPAVDALGARVAVAWFAMKDTVGQVWVALSSDGGGTFGRPTRLPGRDPLGRVDVALLGDGGALVSWLDGDGKAANLQVQRFNTQGPVGGPMTVARTSAARSSGFPRMVVAGRRVLFAWTATEAGLTDAPAGQRAPDEVRVAVAALR